MSWATPTRAMQLLISYQNEQELERVNVVAERLVRHAISKASADEREMRALKLLDLGGES